MQIIDIRQGELLWIGNQPVACLWASGGKARLATPSVIQESVEDLRRFAQRERRKAQDREKPEKPGV